MDIFRLQGNSFCSDELFGRQVSKYPLLILGPVVPLVYREALTMLIKMLDPCSRGPDLCNSWLYLMTVTANRLSLPCEKCWGR